jgi:N-acetyl-gamma-glutamyl-phosphate reductase
MLEKYTNKSTQMIKAGIIGGSGYTGGELIRILEQHPAVEIDFIYSTTRAGKKVSSAHPDLIGRTEYVFTSDVNLEVDVVFLCLGHGNSLSFLKENNFSDNTKIIDLSTDFRAQKDAEFLGRTFVYGLPENHKTAIENATAIANPGCFATALQLSLAPLASKKLITSEVHINATTGSTGAGVKPSDTTHFSWRTSSVSWYKAFNHQHLNEVGEQLTALNDSAPELLFIPNRGNFTRGIFATVYTEFDGSLEDAKELYSNYYKNAPFTHLTDEPIHLKQVVNTNNCHLHLMKHKKYLMITAAIDNLLKGASGQAVQNMNLIFGLEEDMGLQLKPIAF